ncbi:MAG: hypothetical protein M2R45_03625 [Verrucomicrobia subdivision 3 bacterium]|nr:hypothetical protein [Limisphaerales bacterium]MCS1416880.1 hypothetical protein [Limisphaerales bacterium]
MFSPFLQTFALLFENNPQTSRRPFQVIKRQFKQLFVQVFFRVDPRASLI